MRCPKWPAAQTVRPKCIKNTPESVLKQCAQKCAQIGSKLRPNCAQKRAQISPYLRPKVRPNIFFLKMQFLDCFFLGAIWAHFWAQFGRNVDAIWAHCLGAPFGRILVPFGCTVWVCIWGTVWAHIWGTAWAHGSGTHLGALFARTFLSVGDLAHPTRTEHILKQVFLK